MRQMKYNRTRKYKNSGTDMNELNEIYHEVNAFDKSFGIQLKKMNPKQTPEGVFKTFNNLTKEYMLNVVWSLNGFKKIDYDVNFKRDSVLRWDENVQADMYSVLFRYRFLSILLLHYSKHLKEISLKKFERLAKKKVGIYENAYLYLLQMSKTIREFIMQVVEGEDWSTSMIMMNQDLIYAKVNKIDPVKYNEDIRILRYDLQEGCYTTWFHHMHMDEDYAINDILQLAYLIYTGNTNVEDGVPEFRYIDGADTSYDLRGLIEELGNSIYAYSKRNKRPLLVQAWSDSMPNFYSKYEDMNDNYLLNMGIRALWYTKFFCDDRCISEFIDKMIL